MSAERSQPEPSTEPRSKEPAEYEALMRQYGEAMLRIGQLDARMEGLSSRLEKGAANGGSAEPDPEVRPPDFAELLKRVETLEERLNIPTEGAPPRDVAQNSESGSSQRGDEVAQLRIKLAGVEGQLELVGEQLRQTNNRRRRRPTDNPKWMFWRGRKHR